MESFSTGILHFQPGTVAYAAGWGAIIPDDQLGPLAFLIPKEQKRPKVLQVVDVPLIENGECEVWHERAGITGVFFLFFILTFSYIFFVFYYLYFLSQCNCTRR